MEAAGAADSAFKWDNGSNLMQALDMVKSLYACSLCHRTACVAFSKWLPVDVKERVSEFPIAGRQHKCAYVGFRA